MFFNLKNVLNMYCKITGLLRRSFWFRLLQVCLLFVFSSSAVANYAVAKTPKAIKVIVFQDKISLRGTVKDENNGPLVGVNVVVKGTTTGVITGINGEFDIEVENEDVLEFRFIGYTTQEISVNSRSQIDVVLKENISELDEIIVVGYGEQKKANLTGAVGSVSKEFLENKPVVNVQELLQGKTPGLNITNSSGAPGSAASVNIRGTSSIGSSSGVLVIVDGVPGNIYTLNPNDIENISVLKDAASASIYGSRAANGVILVTTKKGSNGGLKVSLKSSIGVQNPQHFIDFVGAKDYMNLYNQARINDGQTPLFADEDFTKLANGEIPDNVWYKEIMEDNNIINNNHLTFSGKSDRLKYNVSLGYDTQEGAMPRDDYERLVVKPYLSFDLASWITLDANVQMTKTNVQKPEGAGDVFNTATRMSPITPVYTPEGRYANPGVFGNPIATVNEGGLSETKYNELLGIFTAIITPLKDWNIRPMYSYKETAVENKGYSSPITLYNMDETIYSTSPIENQSLRQSYNMSSTELFQVTTDYKFDISDQHNFKLLAGYSQEYNKGNNFWASRVDPAFSFVKVLDAYNGLKDNGGSAGHSAFQSIFARVNYDYQGRYLFEANVRWDGSTRFQEGHRWGILPSASVGWNVAEESFIKDNFSFIDMFKLRASSGVLGDAAKVDRYATRNILWYNYRSYVFAGQYVPGALAIASFDPELTWEKSLVNNFGLDLALFNNRLIMNVDYFINTRSRILANQQVPFEYGLGDPLTNALKMENKGFEFYASYRDNIGEVNFNVDFNISHSKNKVLDLNGTGPWKGNSYTDEGLPLGVMYALESDGLFQSQEDIDGHATQTNVKPGNIKYKDQNDDGAITGEDRVIIDEGLKTPYRYGFNLGVNYKNFSFGANFYGVFNSYRYLAGYEGWAFYLSDNARPMHQDSWTPENPNASYPRLTTNMGGNDASFSDYWLRKSSFLKLQSLSLGYHVPTTFSEKLGLKTVNLSLTGQNLAIFSGYDGFDPEGGNYPQPRTFTFSVRVDF